MSKTKDGSGIPKWIKREDEYSGKFSMIPLELFEEPAFQRLSHAARMFYIVCHTHKQTDIQRMCLYQALKSYNQIFDLGMTEADLQAEAKPTKKTVSTKGYFVIPAKHLKQYGYTCSYAWKLKRELEDAGFIKPVFGGKTKKSAWDESIAVYQFSDEWKNKT